MPTYSEVPKDLAVERAKSEGNKLNVVHDRAAVSREIRAAVRHAAVYGLGNILTKAVGFLMLPLYTRFLTPLDYGVLEILDLSMSLFGMFLSMGTSAAVLRCHADAESPEDKRKVVSTALVFVSAIALLIGALGFAFARPLTDLLLGPTVPSSYFLLSFAAFLIGYVGTLGRTYLRALEVSTTLVVADVLYLILLLGLNIYFVAFLQIGVVGILMGALIAGTILSLVFLVWTIREVGIQFVSGHLRQVLAFGWPLMVSNCALFALNFSDRFFLQHFQSLEAVGIYAIGYKFGFMVNYLLVQPFMVMWQTRMYLVYRRSDHEAIFRRVLLIFSFALMYGGLTISILSPEMIHLMVDPKFASSAGVIPFVVVAYIFSGLTMYFQLGLFLTNKTRSIGLLSTIVAGLNLVLNYTLISRFGIIGAALATVLSFAVMAVGSYKCSQAALPLRFDIGRILAGAVGAIGLYLLSALWTPSTFAVGLSVKLIVLSALPVLMWRYRHLVLLETDFSELFDTASTPRPAMKNTNDD